MEKLSHEQFLAYVRSGLNHLYDPDQLRHSPLASLFNIADRLDTPTELYAILLDAIEKLKPGDSEPPQSRAWRIYDILYFRYVQGYDRDRVANQLGFSERQFSREQLTALEILTLQLWKKYSLETRATLEPSPLTTAPETADADPAPTWLKDMPPEKHSSLAATLQSILTLLGPLTRQWQVELTAPAMELGPDLMIPHYALRHALLNVLGIGIPWSSGGKIQLTTLERAGEMELRMECTRKESGPAFLSEKENANLEIAIQLAKINQGSLTLSISPETLCATLTLPVMNQIIVLAIDDNADMLHLYKRYAQGTVYSIVGTQDPTEALELAEKHSPQIILLDVMMPEVDGWDLLMRLRENPRTSFVPIVICTILPQEGLAQSLGANAFLQKPVLPESFIATLDQQIEA